MIFLAVYKLMSVTILSLIFFTTLINCNLYESRIDFSSSSSSSSSSNSSSSSSSKEHHLRSSEHHLHLTVDQTRAD